jgi:predicted glycosyltransferase
MNIIIYCQYVWGMGHLIRSLEFARALVGHNVTLVAGGQQVEVDLPAHVDLVRLATLYFRRPRSDGRAGSAGAQRDSL